jgi:hypothetical protein
MRSRRATRAAAPAALTLTLVVAFVAGCTAEPTPAARLDRLLVLAGDTAGGELRGWSNDPADEDGASIATTRGTAWVAAGRADVLVAVIADGSLRISDPLQAGRKPTWREPDAAGASGEPATGPFYFPTWDPEGGRFAALAGDLDAAARLTLVDPTVGAALEIELGQPVAAAPPVWVGSDLVAILTGTAGDPASILVDTTTGDVRDGPRGARLLATSPDGATVAIVGDDGDPVTIRTTDAWLTGDGSAIGSVDPPPDAITASAVALDAGGGRLAIAWLTDAGIIRVAVHDRDAGWRRVAEPSIGDAPAAVVAWRR